jgi:hypothetical protein
MTAVTAPVYPWMPAGLKPTPQLRMSPADNEACDGFFTRKHRSFTNGRLPRVDDGVKALMGRFSIKTSRILNRLRKWNVANSIPGSVLSLGSQNRAGVEEDLEERISDGKDYAVEVLTSLRQDTALEEGPDMEAVRVAAEASDEVFTFHSGIIVAWCALVLELSSPSYMSELRECLFCLRTCSFFKAKRMCIRSSVQSMNQATSGSRS